MILPAFLGMSPLTRMAKASRLPPLDGAGKGQSSPGRGGAAAAWLLEGRKRRDKSFVGTRDPPIKEGCEAEDKLDSPSGRR